MRLSYKIPIITAATIISTIAINIVAFQYFIGPLMQDYNRSVALSNQNNILSPEKLSTILSVGSLPLQKQDEYKEVVSELSTISTSLKNISENPELYINSKSSPNGSGQSFALGAMIDGSGNLVTRPQTLLSRIGNILTGPVKFDGESPEGKLILSLLSKLLITNLIFLVIVMVIYFVWIRHIFTPINLIIERLNTYIDTSRFQKIRYSGSNEFTPLVSTINNLYQSLRIQENIRSNFLSDMSHEIRTPITAVKCYLEAIEDGVMELDAKTVPLLQTELSRLTRITEKIMEYDHLTRHSTDNIHVERFDLSALTDTLIHEYQPQLDKTKQTIQIEGDLSLRMDKGMFIQILHNVFSNFIKYGGDGTTLTCTYKKNPRQYLLQFVDSGAGIPEDHIEFVKEKFYRIDTGRTQSPDMSMGIGLSIIDHIVRLHDGHMEIRNHEPHGFGIYISLPR